MDLHETLIGFAGCEAFDEVAQTASLSISLPINDPEPALVYPGSIFIATGTYSFGAWRLVIKEIESRGGELRATLSRKTKFLAAGEFGSHD